MKIYKSHDYVKQVLAKKDPAMRYREGEDFNLWHQKARKKLAELLGLPFFAKCENLFTITECKECGNYTKIDFEFQSEEGYFIPCNLLIPAGAKKALPTVICLQGHTTGKHISIGEIKYEKDTESIASGRDFAAQSVKKGYCAIILDQRYFGGAGQSKTGMPSCLNGNEGMATLLFGRTAIGERVWDIMRLIDVIYEHLTEYIDTEKLICMGESGGGTATFYASCMDERICYSVPTCAVCTFEASIMAMYHCPCNFIPGIRNYFNMGDLGGLIAPRPLIVVCGKEDIIFPIDGVEESFALIQKGYKQLGKENLCHLVKGAGGHQFYPDDVWPVLEDILHAK